MTGESEPFRWPVTVIHVNVEDDPIADVLDTCASAFNLLLSLPAADELDHGQQLMVERVIDLMVQVVGELRG